MVFHFILIPIFIHQGQERAGVGLDLTVLNDQVFSQQPRLAQPFLLFMNRPSPFSAVLFIIVLDKTRLTLMYITAYNSTQKPQPSQD